MKGIDYDVLDPGIRKVVRWLREHDFQTTASGDGETADVTAVFDMPYVSIAAKRANLIAEADRLWQLLRIELGHRAYAAHIEATYDPDDETCFILLLRVKDSMLPW